MSVLVERLAVGVGVRQPELVTDPPPATLGEALGDLVMWVIGRGMLPGQPPLLTREEFLADDILRWAILLGFAYAVVETGVLGPLTRRRTRREARELARQPAAVDPFDPDSVAVYRLFDDHDFLLYVGIAADVKVRFGQHAKDKTWWCDVARWEVEWYGDRAHAAAAEARAIVDESPAYNVSGAPEPQKSDDATVAMWVDRIDMQRVRGWQLNSLYVHYLRSRMIPDHAPGVFWQRAHISTVYWYARERAGGLALDEHGRFAEAWEKLHNENAAAAEPRRRRAAAVRAARRMAASRATVTETSESPPRKRRAGTPAGPTVSHRVSDNKSYQRGSRA